MPLALEPEISFSLRLQIREHILAWISRDVGLKEFLIPDLLTDSWTQEQRQAWTNHIMDKYLHTNSIGGKNAHRRILACETAGSLRRHCVRLRQRTATYRDIMKTSVSLESLWNDVSPELDDASWVKCSRWFDVALTSLRVSYLWMYVKTEANGPDITEEVRKGLFEELVDTYFVPEAPTDDKTDKHSSNFKDLLQAWRKDLRVVMSSDKFDQELRRLEESNGLNETAACIERFLGGVDVDSSWVLRMLTLEKEAEKGKLVPKANISKTQGPSGGQGQQPRRGRGRPRRSEPTVKQEVKDEDMPRRSKVPRGRAITRAQAEKAADDPELAPPESDSSAEPEPVEPDSDFDVDAAAVADTNENDDWDEDEKKPYEALPLRTSPRRQIGVRKRMATLRSSRKRAVPFDENSRTESGLAKRRLLPKGFRGLGSNGVGNDVAGPEPAMSDEDDRDNRRADSRQEIPGGDEDEQDEVEGLRLKPSMVESPSTVARDQGDLFESQQDNEGGMPSASESRESRRRRLAALLEAEESQHEGQTQSEVRIQSATEALEADIAAERARVAALEE